MKSTYKYAVVGHGIEERGDFSRYGLTANDLRDLDDNVERYRAEFDTEADARADFETEKSNVFTEQYGPGVSGYNGPHLEATILYLRREEWDGEDYVQGDEIDFFAKPLPAATREA